MTTDMREFIQADDENEATIMLAAHCSAINIIVRQSHHQKRSSLDLRRIMRKSISTDREPLICYGADLKNLCILLD